MKAIHRAHFNTVGKFTTDARIANYVGHLYSPGRLNRNGLVQILWNLEVEVYIKTLFGQQFCVMPRKDVCWRPPRCR